MAGKSKSPIFRQDLIKQHNSSEYTTKTSKFFNPTSDENNHIDVAHIKQLKP
jgi:hypothetical protein